MKKIISVLMAVFMLLSLTGISVSALEEPQATVTYNEENDSIDVVCTSADYFNAVISVSFDTWTTGIGDTGNVTVNNESNSFSVTTSNGIGWNNGTYTFKIEANGYDPLTYELTISKYGSGGNGGEEESNSFPSDFSVEVNGDGDLLIYSADTDFLDAMVKTYDESFSVIIGECGPYYDQVDTNREDYNIPSYFFGAVNTVNDYRSWTPLKRVDNFVVLSVEDQLNGPDGQIYRGQILNDVPYTLIFEVDGYGTYRLNSPVTFPKSNVRIPVEHIGVYVTNGYVIVSARDDAGLDFIKKTYAANIARLDKYNEPIEIYGSGLNDTITSNDFDTINDSYDRIFKVNTASVTDVSDWKGLIDAQGYGQYCYDGRTFGGVVDLAVEKFSVNRHGVDGTVLGTDDALGIYVLPAISPVSGKTVQGWRVIDKDNDVTRCIGEEIFVTADMEIYAIFEDAEPEQLCKDLVIEEVLLNTVRQMRIETNAYNAELASDSFVTSAEKAQGTVIWLMVEQKEKDTPQYQQVDRIVSEENDLISVLDINVFKKVGDGDICRIKDTKEDIPELPGTYIEIAIDLNGDENKDARLSAENGTLGILMIHEGVASEYFGGVYNKETMIYTFKSKLFSTYALVDVNTKISEVVTPEGSGSSASSSVYKVVNTSVH